MKIKTFLICLAVFTIRLDGMKRSHQDTAQIYPSKKTRSSIVSLPVVKRIARPKAPIVAEGSAQCNMGSLPKEVQRIILDYVKSNINAEKPREATDLIRTLMRVDKTFNQHMKLQKYQDEVIKNFAERYRCSHETIAKYLHTPASRRRLFRQYELKNLLYCEDIIRTSCMERLKYKIDLEFTYNRKNGPHSILMASKEFGDGTTRFFLNHGADVNGCNAHGMTPLMVATQDPRRESYLSSLLEHPSLEINKQNKQGETALLRLLKRNDTIFDHVVQALLDAGADPRLPDKQGFTPFITAKNRELFRIVDLLNIAT
jgi:hypothetical protein